MEAYQPSYYIWDATKNITSYFINNLSLIWFAIKPFYFMMLAAVIFDHVVTTMVFGWEETGFFLGSLLSMYFTAALIITWHRVILNGPEEFEFMQVLRPERHEIGFILTLVGLVAVAGIAGAILGIPIALMGQEIFVMGAIILFIAFYVLGVKFSLYFPAKAINQSITLKEAFHLSTGYVWKIIATGLLAVILPTILYFIVLMLSSAFVFTLGYLVGDSFLGVALLETIIIILFTIPILYFELLLTLIGVTVVSNYFAVAVDDYADAAEEINPDQQETSHLDEPYEF